MVHRDRKEKKPLPWHSRAAGWRHQAGVAADDAQHHAPDGHVHPALAQITQNAGQQHHGGGNGQADEGGVILLVLLPEQGLLVAGTVASISLYQL